MIIIKSLKLEYQTHEHSAEGVNIVGRLMWTSKRL